MAVLFRGFLIWLLFIPLAVLNGVLRDLLLAPVLGGTAARALSSVTLSLLLFCLTVLLIRRIGASSRRELFAVGGLWLVLTLLFEFSFFVLVMGHPLDELLGDFDLFRGRLWLLVLATTFFAPFLAARIRRLPG